MADRHGEDGLDPHPHPDKHLSRVKDASLLTRLDILVNEMEDNIAKLRAVVEEEKDTKREPGGG